MPKNIGLEISLTGTLISAISECKLIAIALDETVWLNVVEGVCVSIDKESKIGDVLEIANLKMELKKVKK